MNIGRSIKVLRAAVGLQQRQVAERAGLDPSYVSLLEAGKRSASPEAVALLADALGVPVSIVELLAAEKSELRGIRPAQARQLGLALASALARRA